MNVSVIIPAYNAAITLADTLRSLQAQTFSKWEAIVIDDGSSDDTSIIASRFAHQDRRIRFIRQQNGGPSVARNAGIKLAKFDWLLFLDADDWIAPTHLQRLTESLKRDIRLDAVHCGCVYVAPDGSVSDEKYGDASPDLFPTLANHCTFHICACVVRKSIVEAVGGWDPSFRTCEDWDLWQRIARAGARFGVVKEVLAFYRMQPNSLLRQANQLFIDAMRVLAQGYSQDQRVPNPDPRHRAGGPQEALPESRLYLVSWIAGLLLGKGEDARYLFNLIEDIPVPDLNPYGVADCLLESVPLSVCQLKTAWLKFWPSVERNIEDFLIALEAFSHSIGLAERSITILKNKVLQQTDISTPITLGTTHAVCVEVTEPLPDIRPPAGVQHFVGLIIMEGVKLGWLELPVIDGLIASWVLEDAIAAKFAWAILGRFFEHNLYPGREADEHNRIGWKVFWQQLWGRVDWAADHDSNFERERISTRQVNSDRLMVDVSDELSDLYIAYPEVKVGFTVGGVPLGVVTIPVKNNLLKASSLRVALFRAGGFELCRACVREAIIGRPLNDPTPLRSRLVKAALSQANRPDPFGNGLVSPQTVVLGGRPGILGTSVSRRALLPKNIATELVEMAHIAGEAVLQPPHPIKKPDRILYAPEMIEHLFSQQRSSYPIFPLLTPPRWVSFLKMALKTPILLATLLKLKGAYPGNKRKLLTPLLHTFLPLLWKFLISYTTTLPILMYHRVAPGNGSAPERYVVTPEAFEEQLRYLRYTGFSSIALDNLLLAMSTGRPLPGRGIAITFDDGYQDFHDYAFPLLKKYGFTATMFLVAGSIGKSNQNGEVPLMGWREIHHLKDEGISFGSHSFSHRSLTSLSHVDIVQEGTQSRILLERELGIPVTAFAYPYGHFNSEVEHLIGACGYTIALSYNTRLSHLQDGPLALPRIEVMGSYRYKDLLACSTIA